MKYESYKNDWVNKYIVPVWNCRKSASCIQSWDLTLPLPPVWIASIETVLRKSKVLKFFLPWWSGFLFAPLPIWEISLTAYNFFAMSRLTRLSIMNCKCGVASKAFSKLSWLKTSTSHSVMASIETFNTKLVLENASFLKNQKIFHLISRKWLTILATFPLDRIDEFKWL